MTRMTRRRLLAGNWKMNKAIADVPAFLEAFAKEAGLNRGQQLAKTDVMFAVPYTLLQSTAALFSPWKIQIAAQNVHYAASGAFTGEVSAAMLKEINVTATLIGHSERRQYFGETDESVAKKIQTCLQQKVTAVVCVGETKQEREGGVTTQVVGRQLDAALEAAISVSGTGLGAENHTQIIVAYEPVWAIGTGLSASSAQAQEVHAMIRNRIRQRCGDTTANTVRILYGGSATPANIGELLSQPDIDGGLVGGASLKPADFAAMVRTAEQLS